MGLLDTRSLTSFAPTSLRPHQLLCSTRYVQEPQDPRLFQLRNLQSLKQKPRFQEHSQPKTANVKTANPDPRSPITHRGAELGQLVDGSHVHRRISPGENPAGRFSVGRKDLAFVACQGGILLLHWPEMGHGRHGLVWLEDCLPVHSAKGGGLVLYESFSVGRISKLEDEYTARIQAGG